MGRCPANENKTLTMLHLLLPPLSLSLCIVPYAPLILTGGGGFARRLSI